MRILKAVTGAFLLVVVPLHAYGAGIVFRYLPGVDNLSSSVMTEGVEYGAFLDPRELPARGPRGWGLEPPVAGEFEAPGAVLRSDAWQGANQPLGPQLTIEAWVRIFDLSGTIHLVGNRTTTDGFLLGVANGRAFVDLRLEGNTYRVGSERLLAEGEDHWFAATISKADGGLRIRLFVDGREEAAELFQADLSGAYHIGSPFLVGTKSDDGAQLIGTLTGLVYAAVVRDYVAAEVYLESPPPFDGSTYLGLADFHDYSLENFHLPMDQRITASPIDVQDRFFLPYANDEYVPQGTATRTEISETDTTRLVYISSYHLPRSGVTGTQGSIISELAVSTGKVRRTFRLTGRLASSHAGGIAWARGALFVSSAGYLERYPIPEYEGDQGPKYLDLEADDTGSVFVESKSSFVSEFEDTLWVGDWRPGNDVAPYLFGYALDEGGRPITSNPAVFALPRNVQGVDFLRSGSEVFLFLSRNRNSTEAELLRYRPSQLDRYAVREPDSVITLPHGIEDLSFSDDGKLWTNSESGADYYQRGPNSWSSFYPYVYSVSPTELFPNWTSTGLGETSSFGPPTINVYPNPVSGLATIEFESRTLNSRIEVYDVLGRSVVSFGTVAPGFQQIVWDSSHVPPGVYFLVLEGESHRRVRTVSVCR